jgi:hypothetical protein
MRQMIILVSICMFEAQVSTSDFGVHEEYVSARLVGHELLREETVFPSHGYKHFYTKESLVTV